MKTKTKLTVKNLDLLITPEWLEKRGACTSGFKWAKDVIGKGMTLRDFLPLFERADWMLWTLNKAGALDKIGFVRYAILCAESVLAIHEKKYPEDKRPRKAIEAAIAYCEDPSEENRKAAASAAYAAAYDAAASAAYAAADAAYAASASDAYAAADAAYTAAYAAARNVKHKELCAAILGMLDLGVPAARQDRGQDSGGRP